VAAIFFAGGGSTPESHDLARHLRSALSGESITAPRDASRELLDFYEELHHIAEKQRKQANDDRRRKIESEDCERALGESARRLQESVNAQLSTADETSRLIREMTIAIREVAHHVETLTSSAEESSSSILEMTATNDEVAANVGELAGSVRETVSSIEEMAYSIKEVAKTWMPCR
jgi:methyl-accepting chemotaxis protein